jgi:hypothetical protein
MFLLKEGYLVRWGLLLSNFTDTILAIPLLTTKPPSEEFSLPLFFSSPPPFQFLSLTSPTPPTSPSTKPPPPHKLLHTQSLQLKVSELNKEVGERQKRGITCCIDRTGGTVC